MCSRPVTSRCPMRCASGSWRAMNLSSCRSGSGVRSRSARRSSSSAEPTDGLLVDVADDEEHGAEDGDHVGYQVAGEYLGEDLDVVVRGGAQLEAPRGLFTPGHEVVAVDAERVLGPRVGVALGDLEDLGEPLVDRALREPLQAVRAGVGQVEGDVDLVEEAFEPGQAVALLSGDDGYRQFAVGEVRLVPAQVEVHSGGPRDGAGHAVLQDLLPAQHPHAPGPGVEDLVPGDQVPDVAHPGP